jgi:hypothetical protein
MKVVARRRKGCETPVILTDRAEALQWTSG